MPALSEDLAELDAWLATTDECLRFDLLTITTRTNLVLRWTNADVALAMPDGRVFYPATYERSRLTLGSDLAVDEMQLTVHVDQADLVGGVPMLPFARRGGLDGAVITLEWAYYDVAMLLKGYDVRFEGNSGPADTGLGTIELSARSLIAQLNRQVPAEAYQPGCRNTVYDTQCAANAATHTVSGTVTAVDAANLSHFVSNLAQPNGKFDLGAVRFSSGALQGETRTVKAYAGGAVQTVLPWPVLPAVGDTFTIRPGCDGTKATCGTVFNNLLRFRGEPHIPSPETVA